MQNENDLQNAAKMPPLGPVQVQSGLSTSSGQFTAIFGLAAIVLSLLGYHYSATQIESWASAANNFITTLGPILALIPVLIGYINSRGKIASNAINAQAQIATGQVPFASGGILSAKPITGALEGIQVLSDIKSGGKGSFKDPATYGKILEVAKDLGVPGADHANAVDQQLHPAELIAGIISMFHHKGAK